MPADDAISQSQQHPHRALVERDAALGVGLGVLLNDRLLDLDDRAGDVKRAILNVDVPPTKRTQLAPPRS